MSKTAQSIPEGYHTVTPYLFIKDTSKAIDFYRDAFGAKEITRHLAPDGRIMHAVVQMGDSLLMLADAMPDKSSGIASPTSLKGTCVMLHLYVSDVDAAFQKASQAGCKVRMPLMDTFWGDRYGQVEDPFGHLWSLATHKIDLTDEEIEKGGKEFMCKKASCHCS
jgi:PhnB protein